MLFKNIIINNNNKGTAIIDLTINYLVYSYTNLILKKNSKPIKSE